MVDAVDMASQIEAETVALAIASRAPIESGTAGDCDGCEWWFPRLVDGLCGFCRDGRQPPADWEPHPRPSLDVEKEDPVGNTPASKSVTFVASGAILDELKRRVADGATYNRAAIDMIEAGLVLASTPAPDQASTAEPEFEAVQTPRQRMVQLLDGMAGLVSEILDRPDRSAEVATERQRAEEAEAKLVDLTARIAAVLA
ncbi:hypothetical protein SAMN05192583_0874 [Sphingomonas gellani]|uniref:Uncharacterized protein n=1 Tax=Sphingomonas gellani TaxID=1166340 RepID=A0A1H7ZYR9_9SPHN|nr:hypothetical protein [Sphingomonas gellani]SEM62477.1 hypothetical protein SAMN05192583_0874 [Sphingomonas gellani]